MIDLWTGINMLLFILGLMFLSNAKKLKEMGDCSAVTYGMIGLSILIIDVLSWFVWVVEGSI